VGGLPDKQSIIRSVESEDAMNRWEPDSWYESEVEGARPRMTEPICGPGSVEKSIVG